MDPARAATAATAPRPVNCYNSSMPAVLGDIRFALRMFAKNRGTTAVAVLSLAIAIGPNATLFSILDTLLLHPSPIPAQDRLYSLSVRSEKGWEQLSYADYVDYCSQSRLPRAILVYEKRGALWSDGEVRQIIPITIASENYFQALGLTPALGRLLSREQDERIETDPPVVISHSLWQRRFGGKPDVVGAAVTLNGRTFRLIGVAPPGFRGLEQLIPFDVWVPFSAASVLDPGNRSLLARRDYKVQTFVSLDQAAQAQQAETELSAIAQRLAQAWPATNRGTKVVLSSVERDRRGRGFIAFFLIALITVVLLIACANVSGILFAQAEARRREVAVRLALGARRGRLVRQLLVEGLLISIAGALLGLLMAFWLADVAMAFKPAALSFINYEVAMNWRVMAYTGVLVILTTLAAALVPAMRASRPDIVVTLKGEAPATRVRWVSVRGVLVIAQIAATQFLTAGAMLLLRSYLEVDAIRPGFDSHRNLLLVTVGSGERAAAIRWRELIDRLQPLPGVTRVTFSRQLPLSGSGTATEPVSSPGMADPLPVLRNQVAPGFCAVMGTRVLQGREFQYGDNSNTAMVNETMARRLWGRADAAVGQFFKMGSVDMEVIGVVEDGKYRSLTETPTPHMLLPAQSGHAEGTFIIEAAIDAGILTPAVREALRSASPGLVIMNIATMRQHLRFALFLPQASLVFAAVMGGLALFLASVGLYGVIAYAANRRRPEIGLRVALGATKRDVIQLVMREAAWSVGLGTAVGLAAILAAARVAASALHNVSPSDPLSLLGSVTIVAIVAAAAAFLPARRALELQPMTVLRQD